MVEYNNFWDGTTLGKAGPYSSQIFSAFMQDLLAAHSNLNAGILTGRGNGVDEPLDVQETSPASKQVAVKPGSAIVPQLSSTEPKGARWYYTDDDVNVTIPDNTDGSGFDRIDLLVLRSNSTTQTIQPVLITGTPAGAPVAPVPVRSGAIYDIILAEITALNLFTTITNSDIDTTVQTHTPVWEPINGGTGLEGGYSAGNLIAATGANAMARVNVITQWDRLMYRSAEANLMGWLDDRTAFIYGTGGVSALQAGSWALEQLDSFLDPGGQIVDSLVSNQLTLFEGDYRLLWGTGCGVFNVSGGTFAWRVQNVTAPATISESNLGSVPSANDAQTVNLYPVEFSMNGTDLIEFQAQCTGAVATIAPGTMRAIDWSFGFVIQRMGD